MSAFLAGPFAIVAIVLALATVIGCAWDKAAAIVSRYFTWRAKRPLVAMCVDVFEPESVQRYLDAIAVQEIVGQTVDRWSLAQERYFRAQVCRLICGGQS